VEEEDSVGEGLELAGQMPTVSLPVPIMEVDRDNNDMEVPVDRGSNNKEEALGEGSTVATSMPAINTVLSLRQSRTRITMGQMGLNGRRRGKRQSARRSCVGRWRNLNASVRQKPKKKRESESEKQWRRN
jgi:hypothetical protein